MSRLLSRTSAPSFLTAARTKAPNPGIAHLGLGNFHRAHQAVYTDTAVQAAGGDWGIVGVANRSEKIVNALRAQDFLYTVQIIGAQTPTFTIPQIHSDAFVAAREPQRVVDLIADPAIRIVTMTVTEHGYSMLPSSGGLNVDDAAIRLDLEANNPPLTMIGQIAYGLMQRMRTHGEPITILSCDNVAANGHQTQRLVREFLETRNAQDSCDMLKWLASHVTFPNSMVDRIVPSTTAAHTDAVRDALGYTDNIPVPAEPFGMWVMEDNFAAGRPAWEVAGAEFSNEVEQYEELKLRLLNGTHSLIAYLGVLADQPIIPKAVALPWIAESARQVLRSEYLPSVRVPQGLDVATYEEDLFKRWQNVDLGHRTSQVGSDGSVKLPQRVIEPAHRMLDQGQMPQYLALTVASYLSAMAPLGTYEPGKYAQQIQDPLRPELVKLAQQSTTGSEYAKRVLQSGQPFGAAFAHYPAFTERVGELITIIHQHGPQAATTECLQASASQGGESEQKKNWAHAR